MWCVCMYVCVCVGNTIRMESMTQSGREREQESETDVTKSYKFH